MTGELPKSATEGKQSIIVNTCWSKQQLQLSDGVEAVLVKDKTLNLFLQELFCRISLSLVFVMNDDKLPGNRMLTCWFHFWTVMYYLSSYPCAGMSGLWLKMKTVILEGTD